MKGTFILFVLLTLSGCTANTTLEPFEPGDEVSLPKGCKELRERSEKADC